VRIVGPSVAKASIGLNGAKVGVEGELVLPFLGRWAGVLKRGIVERDVVKTIYLHSTRSDIVSKEIGNFQVRDRHRRGLKTFSDNGRHEGSELDEGQAFFMAIPIVQITPLIEDEGMNTVLVLKVHSGAGHPYGHRTAV
jgi:hypothetical protein